MRIKKGDNVQVITGKDKNKQGIVKKAFPKLNKVIIEGINIKTKHIKPTQKNPDGGIKKIEAGIDVSNVMLIDPKHKKQLTKITYKFEDNKKIRITKKSKVKV